MSINDLFPVLWIAMMLSIVAALFLFRNFVRNLERRHPATWHDLGAPTLFFNNSLRNNFRVLRFLLRKQYLPLKDDLVARQAMRVLVGYGLALVLFVLTLFTLPFANQ